MHTVREGGEYSAGAAAAQHQRSEWRRDDGNERDSPKPALHRLQLTTRPSGSISCRISSICFCNSASRSTGCCVGAGSVSVDLQRRHLTMRTGG